jgi:cell division protein FtsB
LAFEDFKLYQRKEKLAAQISFYQRQIQEIEKSSQTLKEEIANADNPQYLEKIAYEQLGEQKPGEQEIIFITPQPNPEQPAAQQNILDTKSWLNWFSQSWNWIKSKF